MKGSEGGQGFMPISVIGDAIEKEATDKAQKDIQAHLNELLQNIWTAFPLCKICPSDPFSRLG